jgi:hypothetical protein
LRELIFTLGVVILAHVYSWKMLGWVLLKEAYVYNFRIVIIISPFKILSNRKNNNLQCYFWVDSCMVKDFWVLTEIEIEARRKQTKLYIKYLHVTTMVNRLIENQMILVKIIPMITYLFEAQTLLCNGSSLELRYIDAFYNYQPLPKVDKEIRIICINQK